MGLINFKKIQRAKHNVGGREVAVAISPRPEQTTLATTVWQTFKSLLTGMKITAGYLFRPSTVVTQQYPENRETLQMFDRYRAQLKLVYDEAGGRLGARIAPLFGAVLDDDGILPRGLDELLALEDVVATRLLDADVFARLNRPDRRPGMPVVRRCYHHRVYILIV